MTRLPAFLPMVLGLSIAGASVCYAQSTYSQAASISPSQFFASLKEVSLDLESDPSLARYISLAEQRGDVERTLGSYGITVRPNSPVTLVVAVTYTDPVIESRNSTTNSVDERTVVHGIYISTRFFIKAAALRNGKLHPVRAAFGVAWSGSTQGEDNGVRKFLFGDSTQQDIKNRFTRIFAECLMTVSSNNTDDAPPWPVGSWPDKAKAAADAEFTKIMSPSTPVDKSPFEGVSVAPEISLNPQFNSDDCKADPNWRGEWTRAFQRLRWTDPQQPPSLMLNHYFSCTYSYGLAAPRYFAISDRIYLTEENLVFVLNGRVVRKRGELTTSHHETLAIESDAGDPTNERMNAFLSRNITDFLTDLVLGNGPLDGANPGGGQAPQTSGNTNPKPAEDNSFGAQLLRAMANALAEENKNKQRTAQPDTAASTAESRAALLKWVREDVNEYIAASANGFEAYKKGDVIGSPGLRSWVSNVAPAASKGCWVVQGDTATTFSCLLSTSTDLNAMRSYYAHLTDDVTASLPAGWSPLAAPAFGPDFPASKGYRSSSGAHGEIWIAHAASGEYELHYQLVTAEHDPRPAANSAPFASDDDPIGSGGFITPPDR